MDLRTQQEQVESNCMKWKIISFGIFNNFCYEFSIIYEF